ncbi:MAG: sugar transferase, partial [Clostridia bacterium]|nr:sugar transferase [Clostridia bacterium]
MSKKNNVWKFENYEIKYSEAYSDEFYQDFINNFQKNTKKRLFYKFIKRAFDIFASLFALIVLSPLLLGIAIAIKLDSKGPVLFKQNRIGHKNKVFTIYKFRSMRIDAPHDKEPEDLKNANLFYTK